MKNPLIRQLRLAIAAAERHKDERPLSSEIVNEISAANLALSRVRGSDLIPALVAIRGGGVSLALPLDQYTIQERPEKERKPSSSSSGLFNF
ncbi:MAG: hypothetical protein JNJ44_12395 [Zoogloeaceae bacterium]|nr:hypothetical protein [Zoogloeaceae bacterium]